MKTEEWIEWLAADVQPVDPAAHAKRVALAVSAGTAAAALIAVQSWGLRSFQAEDWATLMLWVRWAFCLAVLAAAWHAVNCLARPGVSTRRLGWLVGAPFGLMALLGLAQWASADPTDRWDLLMGSTALQCPTNIATTSLPVFVASLWVMRRMAPVQPAWAGAAAGLLAGSVGALGYTFHCTELTAPFLAVWYVLGMAIPTACGALIGVRLLKW